MRSDVAVGSFGLDTRWTVRRAPGGSILLRFLRKLVRPARDPFELVVSRSVDQAFAEFAREMER
jgi:hypothetical protein